MGVIDLGIDIGSISINTVVMDSEHRLLEDSYTYCQGRPFRELLEFLAELLERHSGDKVRTLAFTGSGGTLAAGLLGGRFVNEVVAQATSVIALYPHARSVIEMGGEDSKLIRLSGNGKVLGVARLRDGTAGGDGCGVAASGAVSRLEDFAMNSMCAAGTGSFLDQQARRMGLSIEREFGELALASEHPPRIAGRCSVFAKSDMIHLQQIATPVHDIAAGLCFAVARNFKSNLARGKRIEKPVVFQGGVAANAGMVRAFRELLELDSGELVVPEHHASMGAIGALYRVVDDGGPDIPFTGLAELRAYLAADRSAGDSLPTLAPPAARVDKEANPRFGETLRLPVSLGLDVGSLSTNVVLIDDEDRVVARRYLPTASRPLEAIQRGLAEIAQEVGERVEVVAVGTTGSGRYLTGDFVGADVIQNEITAQATAAIAIDPTVDTIFEIGGQDSKFISIQDGVVVDFEMNKVCAAGTGSFLEEQAEKLGINIVDEFGAMALAAERPVRLGDRCTVFMESDLNSHQQKGANTENLVGGLAYSIVQNYIQKVVGTKRIGEHIFFQGGVANNRAVVSAFAAVTGKTITVPPQFDVTGAIGAAMLARARLRESACTAGGDSGGTRVPRTTRFKGFGRSRAPYVLDRFTCKGCANECEIRKVTVEGERRPLFYGGRCEKWERDERKGKGADIPNLFEERTRLLMGDYREEPDGSGPISTQGAARGTIGIPRALMLFYQQFPFWRTFFELLGFRVVLSRPTDPGLIQSSLELLTAETCFPVEVTYGHVRDLLDRGVDWVFLPFVVNARAERDNPTTNYNCPWVQAHPFMIRAALREREEWRRRLLTPTLHFRYYERVLPNDLAAFMGDTFGAVRSEVLSALKTAGDAQAAFERAMKERGKTVLQSLPADRIAAVVLGRPYNTSDPLLNLSLAEKLIGMEVLPIPIDFLPLERERLFESYYMMYWPNGQKILAAARIIARDERLNAIYLSNFRCGPDSFLAHYVREELAAKPYLQLEVDEHSADAGMITRCEAFLDSLKARRGAGASPMTASARSAAGGPADAPAASHRYRMAAHAQGDRTLYFPYMADGGHALAAACRSCGVEAEVLPMQDEEDLKLARGYTSAKECFPMICTLGSFLKKMREPGFNPRRAAFFMPDHGGPCRFGQYNKLQRIIFDRLGFGEVEIVAPSNEDAYAGLSGGHGNRFRLAALQGVFAVDLLRKLQQERRPYEASPGETDRVYRGCLERIVRSTEGGAGDMRATLAGAAEEFRSLRQVAGPRKPLVAVVGEIFMRDNPFCSGHLVERLERLGAETIMAPFIEWMTYSTLRYARDSLWKRDWKGYARSKTQGLFMHLIMRRLSAAVEGVADLGHDVHVEEMLARCEPYVHRDYDGDPAIAIGTANLLADRGLSGVVHLMPFTCLPGTIVSGVTGSFRADHENLPWANIDFDGQEDTGIETRLQAFLHQATEFARAHGNDRPHDWRPPFRRLGNREGRR